MEPDISILRKTGHFYFALTRSHASPTSLKSRPLKIICEDCLNG